MKQAQRRAVGNSQLHGTPNRGIGTAREVGSDQDVVDLRHGWILQEGAPVQGRRCSATTEWTVRSRTIVRRVGAALAGLFAGLLKWEDQQPPRLQRTSRLTRAANTCRLGRLLRSSVRPPAPTGVHAGNTAPQQHGDTT